MTRLAAGAVLIYGFLWTYAFLWLAHEEGKS
jgi:hypothetical protein